MINRLILWLSLAGMILAIHLWVQKARGFDQGCLGLETHGVVAMEGGCADAGLEAGSHLFGISNAAWGYAFYFGLAVLSFAKIVLPTAWARRTHLASEVAVAVGFLYSGYLLYFQAFVAHAFCVLCSISCGLIALLLLLHVLLRRKGGYKPVADANRATELGLAGGALFVAMGVLVGILVFVNRLGTRPLDDGHNAMEMRRIVGRMLPAYIAEDKLTEMRACHFDGMVPPLDSEEFIHADTPFLGKADGIPVVLFSDPYCPHCRRFYPVYMKLAKEFGDRARFYILPDPLWDFSIPAIAALDLAKTSGKYFELWELLVDRPGNRRLTTDELSELCAKAGINPTDLAKRIEGIRPQVIAARRQAARAGINVLPALYIGNYKVFPINYSEECLRTLIMDALPNSARVANSPMK